MKTEEIKKEKKIKTKKENAQVSGFIVRVISAIILIAALIAYCGAGIIYQEVNHFRDGKWIDIFAYFSMFMSGVLVAYCTFEIVRVFKELNRPMIIIAFIVLNLFIFMLPTVTTAYDFGFYKDWAFAKSYWGWVLTAILVIYFVIFVVVGTTVKGMDFRKAMLFFLGSISIVFAFKGFTIIMLAGHYPSGGGTFSYITVLWLWLMVIFADTFAYLGGWKWGKHKMAPVVSPKKTWEGAFVGVGTAVGAGILISLLLHFLANGYEPFSYSVHKIGNDVGEIVILIVLSIVFPIISVLGDLLFSLIKRTLGVKDYSNLIPGHGGALDRLDSFILVNAVAFVLVAFVK